MWRSASYNSPSYRIRHYCSHDVRPWACFGGAVGSVAVRAAWLRWSASLGSRPWLAGSFCQVIAAYALRLNSRADGVLFNLWPLANTGFRDAIVLVAAWTTDNRWPPAVCAGINGSVHNFTRTDKWTLGTMVRCAHELSINQSINQSINEISIAPPTKSGRRRLTM